MTGEGKESTKVIRVLLVDDHQVVRVGIRKVLSRTTDIQVVGEASNGMEAVQQTRELEPDVMLLDIEMPGMSGLDVARRLRKMGSQTRILVLSGYDDREYIQALLNENIAGYVIKSELPDRIIAAVRLVAQGSIGWFSSQNAESFNDRTGHQASIT